ncbi:hypothetical protein [Caulobacter sp.]|uniref:hypothetical protein n=1 Tax=Caulobacter sp. TaxID=78 RepID=UPI002B48971F|nr:hypothetical protein [Caulobacter sp.]HJV40710.1 hypothetical protein [Caulobacter sp.]
MRVIVFSVLLAASPALAQQSPATTPAPPSPPQTVSAAPTAQVPPALDPLADLIAQSGQDQGVDEEQAEAASKPAPRHKPTLLPIPPPESSAPALPGAPVPAEQVYEMRVRGSIAAAQNLQGPLDGGWRVEGADGAGLYALQLVDKAGGAGTLEGAWRDLRRPGAVGSTGLIDELRRDGEDVVARFGAREGQTSTLTLRPTPDGRWTGELIEDGAIRPVVADHLLPEAPPGYEARGRGPYVWPPRASANRPAPAAAPVCSTKGKKGKALKAAKAKCAAAARKGKASTLKKGKASKAKGKKVSSRKKRR